MQPWQWIKHCIMISQPMLLLSRCFLVCTLVLFKTTLLWWNTRRPFSEVMNNIFGITLKTLSSIQQIYYMLKSLKYVVNMDERIPPFFSWKWIMSKLYLWWWVHYGRRLTVKIYKSQVSLCWDMVEGLEHDLNSSRKLHRNALSRINIVKWT